MCFTSLESNEKGLAWLEKRKAGRNNIIPVETDEDPLKVISHGVIAQPTYTTHPQKYPAEQTVI